MSFLGRIFGKRAASRPAPEDWQLGDQAECIIAGQWYTCPEMVPSGGPEHGQVMKVTGVKLCTDPYEPEGKAIALAFAGWPGHFFASACFRKVRPRADEASPAEAEFIQLVRRPPAPVMPRETIEEHQ